MTSKDLFGVAVRVIGLWVLIQGAIFILLRLPYIGMSVPQPFSLDQLLLNWSGGIVQMLVGGWVLLKADMIIRLVYDGPAAKPLSD